MAKHNHGIVIATSLYTQGWLKDCLQSIHTLYPVLIVENGGKIPSSYEIKCPDVMYTYNDWNGFELGAILHGIKLFNDFVFLPDTCIIKDNSIFTKCFEQEGGVELSPNFLSYIGKYDSKVIEKIGVPKVDNQRDAVAEEFRWTHLYKTNDPHVHQLDEMLPVDPQIFEFKNDRNNMIVENKYIKKYKGTWDVLMIRD